MKATLIYIECNRFSGVMRILLSETILSVELATPSYNDYGEYRLDSTDIDPMPLEVYKEKFAHEHMNHEICELSPEDMEFWNRFIKQYSGPTSLSEDYAEIMTDGDVQLMTISEDDANRVICGQDKEKVYHIWYNGKWVPYEDWKTQNNWNSYNKLMYPSAELFYQWYNEKITLPFNPNWKNVSINMYPK